MAWADNLKVVLVMAVIVAHATIAWTNLGDWVLYEPPVREPLRSAMALTMVTGVLFGMAVFFAIAGLFTAPSLARKGPARFMRDRLVRLGVPLLFFIIAITPVVEYVDADNAGWEGGFASFALYTWTWWPPAPGPLWFLAVLLVFSFGYAVVRLVLPGRASGPSPLLARHVVLGAVGVAAASFAIRFVWPFATEVWRLHLAQLPAWVAGFTFGVLGGERGWFSPVEPALARGARRVAWAALAGFVLLIVVSTSLGVPIERFAVAGTWEAAGLAIAEATLVMTMPIWLFDLFQRRFDHQGELARRLGRAAFAAFVVHQVVLVGVVLATRAVGWVPEVEFLAASVLGVVGSFAVAALVLRIPGVSRIV